MFTGIIEELAHIRHIRLLADSAQLSIEAHSILDGTQIGDSIAVNGVCLTVTSLASSEFTADIMLETLTCTTLKDLKPRAPVNLERAMTLQTRLGGHFVSGHIDGIGAITTIRQAGIAKVFEITAPPHIAGMIVPKGSIAVDGISLTVVSALPHSFTISLIPHTLSQTTLAHKPIGSTVNLETDILGKYVARFITPASHPVGTHQYESPGSMPHNTTHAKTQDPLTRDFLGKHGYL
ncbi:MAG: riboflavin synthase [Peptococcaceae bacterium]|nr:riboflavin synthase [Peptococcaceae bacterium]